MAEIELKAQTRTVLGKKVNRLRREGWIPAVIYGASVESRALQVPSGVAEKVVSEAGSSQLVAVYIDKEKEPVQAVIRDFQRDVILRHLQHIDLYQVDMTQTISVEVPIVLIGESHVIENREGILNQGLQSVEIECLPGDLIDAIEIDLSELVEIDQQIVVGDLALPSTVTVLSGEDEMIVRLSEMAEIEEIVEEEELFEELLLDEEGEPILVGEEEEEEEGEETEE